MTGESRLPLGVRVTLSLIWFARVGASLLVVFLMLSGFLGWAAAATATTLDEAIAGVVGLVVAWIALNGTYGVVLVLDAFANQLRVSHSGLDEPEVHTDWKVAALRDLLAGAQTSLIFLFGIQAVLALGIGVLNGFSNPQVFSLISGAIIAVVGTWLLKKIQVSSKIRIYSR